ncbi:hypothetical protein LCGC14_1245360 [marine sediment metagenome]|uniref:Carboxylesterase type B domain-containing protein n=1 Tax=marine sediment metagenome TaxID=412755 RepID=A0A0F9L8I5_9ZZZZ
MISLEENCIVETTCGKVRGYGRRGVMKFKGIPYASPPVESLRFKPPSPVESWEGVRDTLEYSPISPQPSSSLENMFGEARKQDEATCLTLNIWTQAIDDKKRPVMFFIHGGAFLTGNGGSLDGSRLVLRGDVVVVSINYRLGVLGFLYMPEIHDTTANIGLLDMVAALKWTIENISKFGGNPQDITIFGESAGASAVACLLAMPSAKGLFQKAILQSTAARKNRFTVESGKKIYESTIQKLGIKKGVIKALYKVPSEEIVKTQNTLERVGVSKAMVGPVVDGIILPEHPLEAIRKGYAKDIKIFIGSNLDENKLWTMWNPKAFELTEEGLTKTVKKLMRALKKNENKAEELLKVYRHSRKTPRDLEDAILTDYTFHISSIRIAEYQSQHQPNTFMYLFTWKSPLEGGKYGAMHILELPFVFGLMGDKAMGVYPRRTQETQELSEKMMDAWISFARTGNPNHENIPALPPYDLQTRATIVFDKDITIVEDPYSDERVVWDDLL